MRVRSYNSKNGRFTTEDPVRDGENWYVYCEGNPVGFCDPSGLFRSSDYNLTTAQQNLIKIYDIQIDDIYNNIYIPTLKRIFINNVRGYADIGEALSDYYLKGAINKTNVLENKKRNLRTNKYECKSVCYDVPAFKQKRSNNCWAYADVMMYAYKSEMFNMTQSEADKLALQLTGGGNDVGYTDSIGSPIPANNFDVLYSLLEKNGPVYSTFKYVQEGKEINHTIVVTGATINLDTGEKYVAFNNDGSKVNCLYDDFAAGKFLGKSKNAHIQDYSIPAYNCFK